MWKEYSVPEDNVKDSKDRDKKRSIAFSMKLVNGVYNKLIEVFRMQIQEEKDDDYVRGWNDAFTTVIQMTMACKYTKKDYMEMIKDETGRTEL